MPDAGLLEAPLSRNSGCQTVAPLQAAHDQRHDRDERDVEELALQDSAFGRTPVMTVEAT
jgi:hypothetical protein